MGREGGLTAASAGCPHRHRASKSQPAARHTSGTRILLWLPQLLQHPHGIPGPFGPIDIILRGYWEESQSQEGAVSVPVMLVHLGEEKAFIRVKRLKKKKRTRTRTRKKKLFFPPPLPSPKPVSREHFAFCWDLQTFRTHVLQIHFPRSLPCTAPSQPALGNLSITPPLLHTAPATCEGVTLSYLREGNFKIS